MFQVAPWPCPPTALCSPWRARMAASRFGTPRPGAHCAIGRRRTRFGRCAFRRANANWPLQAGPAAKFRFGRWTATGRRGLFQQVNFMCGPPFIAMTAPRSPPPAAIKPCAYGTPPRWRRFPCSMDITVKSGARRSARMDKCWPPAARIRTSCCGARARTRIQSRTSRTTVIFIRSSRRTDNGSPP